MWQLQQQQQGGSLGPLLGALLGALVGALVGASVGQEMPDSASSCETVASSSDLLSQKAWF